MSDLIVNGSCGDLEPHEGHVDEDLYCHGVADIDERLDEMARKLGRHDRAFLRYPRGQRLRWTETIGGPYRYTLQREDRMEVTDLVNRRRDRDRV